LDNTGDIEIASGGRWVVSGGQVNHLAGSLGGAGILYLSSATLDISVDTTATLVVSSSTVSGTATLTMVGTTQVYNGVVNADLVNEGYLDVRHTTGNQINGAFVNAEGATVRILAETYSAANRYATLTVANGLTNAGAIELTNYTTYYDQYSTTSTLNVTTGVLVNDATGVINVTCPRAHNAQQINASIDNRGTINVYEEAVTTKAGGTFTNTGTLYIEAGEYYQINSGAAVTNLATGALTDGTYTIAGTWRFDGAVVTSLAAALILDGAASNITNLSNVGALTGLAEIATGGALTIRNGRNFTTNGSFGNAGVLTVGDGRLAAVRRSVRQPASTCKAAASPAQARWPVASPIARPSPPEVHRASLRSMAVTRRRRQACWRSRSPATPRAASTTGCRSPATRRSPGR